MYYSLCGFLFDVRQSRVDPTHFFYRAAFRFTEVTTLPFSLAYLIVSAGAYRNAIHPIQWSVFICRLDTFERDFGLFREEVVLNQINCNLILKIYI